MSADTINIQKLKEDLKFSEIRSKYTTFIKNKTDEFELMKSPAHVQLKSYSLWLDINGHDKEKFLAVNQ